MANAMNKKTAIQNLEYVLEALYQKGALTESEKKYYGTFIYNILMFHFKISKRKLDGLVKRSMFTI